MNARLRRITADYEEIRKNFDGHKNIIVEPIGSEPAEKYKITYYINGIYLNGEGKIETLNKHIVTITLHSEYPRYKPLCNIETPIWHPNFRDGQICIGDIWGAGESLSDIIVNIGDMIQYKSWNSFSPLSSDAAKWAIENKHLFPVSNVDLWTGEEVVGISKSNFDIDIFDEEDTFEEAPENEDDLKVFVHDEDKLMQENISESSEPIDEEEQLTKEDTNIYEENSIEEDNESIEGNIDSKLDSIQEKNELIEENINSEADSIVKEANSADLEENSVDQENHQIEEKIINQADSGMGSVVLEKSDENDFDITMDELNGIEFVPTAAKMQGNQYSTVADSKKINFKTIFFKGILYGLIGGILAFVVHELLYMDPKAILAWQGHPYEGLSSEVMRGKITEAQYYSLVGGATLISSAISSAIIGGAIGAVMGIGEGIYYGSKEKAIKYGLIGLGIALLIGLVGGFLAQILYSGLLSNVTADTSKIYLGFARAIVWAVMGAGVGIATGLIKPEKMRIINCMLGGVIGGFIGGFLFNFIAESMRNGQTDAGIVPRAIGITIMGTLIGLGIGVLEQFAKAAWLKVVRGEFEGKEYLVFQGVTSIGNSGKNTIVLFKDKLVAPNHCDIVQQGREYLLVDKGTPSGTFVNGMRVGRHTLRQGDAISIGNSILVFNTK